MPDLGKASGPRQGVAVTVSYKYSLASDHALHAEFLEMTNVPVAS